MVPNTQRKKRKTTAESATDTTDPCSSTSLRVSLHSAASEHSTQVARDVDTAINSDVCCVCYHTFEDDQRKGKWTRMGTMCLWKMAA